MTDIPTTPTRKAGKTGRKPALQGDARLPIPWFHEVFSGAATPATYPLDVTGGRQIDWLMLGNGPDNTVTVQIPGFNELAQTGAGDCFFAALGHDEILAGGQVDANGTLTLYFTYDDDQDLGVVIANALLWCYQKGIIDLFAPVHPDNVDSTMQLVHKGAFLGVNLTSTDQQNFEQDPPVMWECGPGNPPQPDEGHVVYKVKSQAYQGDGTIVTWGAEQPVGASWLAQQPAGCVEEAWIVLTATDKERLPADQWNTYVAALDALPGATPPKAPEPAPAPQPGPAPEPAAAPEPGPVPTPPGPPPAPAPDGPPVPAEHRAWYDSLEEWYRGVVAWVESQPDGSVQS